MGFQNDERLLLQPPLREEHRGTAGVGGRGGGPLSTYPAMRRAPLFALVLAACAMNSPHVLAPVPVPPAPVASSKCADTPMLTREADALLADGRLARATALLERTNLECPASAAPLRGWQ